MNTAHEALAAIQHRGAIVYSSTALAASHGSVTRRVRRDRTVRAGVATLSGVGLAGAGTFGALQLRGADALGPMGTPSPSTSDAVSPSPVPSVSATPGASPSPESTGVLDVAPGERADDVIERLAEAYDADVETAREAVVSALPPEADGEPEGWLAVGLHAIWDEDGKPTRGTLTQQAASLSRATERILEGEGIPREEWRETLLLASVVQAEAPMPDDMAGVAAVIVNRLDEGMMLEIESPLRYYAAVNDLEPSDDGWLIDTPYNTFMYEGPPPTPIGSPSDDAIRAALEPEQEDWRYFVRDPDTDRVLFASTFEEHQENLVEVGAIEPEDVGTN